MDYQICGVTLYYIISWFFIYSFLGWVWESCYVSVKSKKMVNRGFINGPFCTIYGFGAISVFLSLKGFSGNLLYLYIGGVAVATILELITGWLMEVIFHTRWWDYSEKKYNFHGYICLGSSAAWGVFTIVLFKVLHPFVSWLTGLYPQSVGKAALLAVGILYLSDFITSAAAAFNLKKGFVKAEEMLEDLTAYIQSTKLYETTEEIRSKLEEMRPLGSLSDAVERSNAKRIELIQRLEERLSGAGNYAEKKAELEQRLDEFVQKHLAVRKKFAPVRKRMLRAYPELRAQYRNYKDRKAGKKSSD